MATTEKKSGRGRKPASSKEEVVEIISDAAIPQSMEAVASELSSDVCVTVQKMYSDVDLPTYQTTGSACADIRAYITEEWLDKMSNSGKIFKADKREKSFYIHSNATIIIPTGIKVSIPKGYRIEVLTRSGLGSKGIQVHNAPGIIDSDYRGECGVILHNNNQEFGFKVVHGDRVAQIAIVPVYQIVWSEVDVLDETERGEGGFNSTGTK